MIDQIDRWCRRIGRFSAFFSLCLVVLIFIEVIFRYAFNLSAIWVGELSVYFFTILILLNAPYAFQMNKHVRVDVFYGKYNAKQKALVNLIGCALLIIPWIIVVVKFSSRYALRSFAIRETSSNPGGLPMLYVLKFIVVFSFLLLGAQTIAIMLRSYLQLKKKSM